MSDRFLMGALRFFPVGLLFIVGFHWIVHRYGPDRAARSKPGLRKNTHFRRRWYVLLSVLVAILTVSAALNLTLSRRVIIIAGFAEALGLAIWTIALCILLCTPWGEWFARETQNWKAFRTRSPRLQRPMLISAAFAQLAFLLAVLAALWSVIAAG